jgi:myo-inositol-1(or 4)-monophosphatase
MTDPADAKLHGELQALAERAARAAGAVAREWFDGDLQITLKTDGSEVTQADQLAQRAALDIIRAARPGDGVIAEEEGLSNGPAAAGGSVPRVVWAIDPIDGTRNYVRGIPYFACSVGALVDGSPAAGAIYEPLRDTMYAGAVGGAMTVNDRPRRVLDGDRRTLLGAIPSKHHKRVSQLVHAWVDRLVVRNTGSTALHLAMVAAGQLDAALATDAYLWDIAAGCAMIVAGGGAVSAPDGRPVFPLDLSSPPGETPVLAAGPRTHTRLVASG